MLDLFSVSTYTFLLNLGVYGIAISNIIVYFFTLIIASIILYNNGLNIFKTFKLNYSWFKGLFNKGSISGLESLVRNFAFIFMIVRMVNVVGEQGAFWIANNFIWGWLLLPFIQLGELIKSDTGSDKYESVKEKSVGYFIITTIIVIIWFISIPIWKPFLRDILKISTYNDVFFIVLISIGFYVLLLWSCVIGC